MRDKDEPVEVTYFTRKITPDVRLGENPSHRTETRVFASWGPAPIPDSAFSKIREAIRVRSGLRIEEAIGAGGTGVVFIAKHETLALRRAVKVMYYGDRTDKDSFLDALTRSLSAVTQMHHQSLIRVHDVVVTDTYAYLVMDLHNPDRNFRSLTASAAVRRKPQAILVALEQVLEVLSYCHSTLVDLPIHGSRGVFVHGDLKAENVLVDYQGRPVVTDWLIPNLGRTRGPDFPHNDTRFFGTPMYMPPEQSFQGIVTPASDVWNFGVLAFEAVTGYYPFEKERHISQGVVMSVHRFAPFAPSWIEAIIKLCLKSDYRQRPTDGTALLHAWRRSAPWSARREGSTAGSTTAKKIFLSSTFRDLTAERDAVRRALRRLGTVDIVAMEERGAYPTPPRDVCLAEVENCDLLVLVLGDNHGSTDALSGLSMTRLEYEHARTCGIPVLAYVRRRGEPELERLAGSPEDEIDPRVQEFLARLDGITCSSFAGPNDLSIQVICDVARLTQSN